MICRSDGGMGAAALPPAAIEFDAARERAIRAKSIMNLPKMRLQSFTTVH
jgi:hypothetical protein